MSTTLAFRTPLGGVDIPVGEEKRLGVVDVHPFDRIRVVALEAVGSAGPVVITLTITEGDGEQVAFLDTLNLEPHSEISRVHEVPSTKLSVFADAQRSGSGSGTSKVGVFIYGSGG